MGNLKTHQRLHTDDKPFVCALDDCAEAPRTFAQLGNLKTHQNKIHGATIIHLSQVARDLRAAISMNSHNKQGFNGAASGMSTQECLVKLEEVKKLFGGQLPDNSSTSSSPAAKSASNDTSNTSLDSQK